MNCDYNDKIAMDHKCQNIASFTYIKYRSLYYIICVLHFLGKCYDLNQVSILKKLSVPDVREMMQYSLVFSTMYAFPVLAFKSA